MTLIKTIKNFGRGIINSIEETSIPKGSASDSLNWVTELDSIRLRRGMKLIGTSISGLKKVTGLHTGQKADGTDISFLTYDRKIKYYDTVTEEWIEIGTNTLPAGAIAEDIAFSDYHSLAGAQVWLSGENSSLYKIMTANPGSITDMSETTFRGLIRIKQGRIFLWNRKDDKTGIYLSWIDAGNSTAVSTENVGTADDTTKTFTGTLAFKAGGIKRTCFGIEITDGTETFTDNYNGVLTGDKGGTGTINYTTGEYSITFNTAPTTGNNPTADYSWEDSTDDGLADFAYSATRIAGEGDVFRQDDAGEAMSILSLKNVEYCLHKKKTYYLTLTADDTNATNLVYREKVGIPNWRAALPSGEGIYYVDNTDEKDPKIRLLRYESGSDQVLPISISDNLDLSDYRFNDACLFEYGDYILLLCRHKDKTYNNTCFAYNKKWSVPGQREVWDRHDFWGRCCAINNGNLWLGDSISANVWEIFSGLDDDESNIINYWNSGLTDLEIENLKKFKKLILLGNIGPDQQIKVFLSFDNNPFIEVGTIDGSSSYVDKGQKVNVGSMTIGVSEIGGGGADISAYNFVREIDIRQDKFQKVKIRFEATKIGWAEISRYDFKDVRIKQLKQPTKYRT